MLLNGAVLFRRGSITPVYYYLPGTVVFRNIIAPRQEAEGTALYRCTGTLDYLTY